MTKELESWIFSHYGQEVYTPGLDRIKSALSELKNKLPSKIVIIAGTNGKGETTHRLGEYFRTSTFCTWTSPHINSMTERFSSEKGDISAEELQTLAQECHQLVQTKKFRLSYYEFLFFVFCTWAAKKNPEYLFLEVGLGGRLDAVNALDAQLVLLTSISRDHQEFLGRRYDEILAEKLGVLRTGATLISFLDLEYLKQKTQQKVTQIGARHVDLSTLSTLKGHEFSLRNQVLAFAAYCHLHSIPIDMIKWRPSEVNLPFRGQVIQGQNQWWLYGSHNVDGMRKLIQFLHSANYNLKDQSFDAIVTSFSKRNESDVRVMLKMLKGARLGKILVTVFAHPKAYPGKELEKLALQEGLKFVEDIGHQVQGWKNQKVLVVGSYYFLGELQPLLGHR